MITDKQIEQLNAKLAKENVSTRKGAGNQELSYVEGHHAIREANRIFGFDGWSGRRLGLRLIGEFVSDGKTNVAYECHYAVDALGVTKEDTGYGDGTDRNALKAHELAVKEAVTDARKRCLMMFGDQFGLALYDKAQTHVEKPGKDNPKPRSIPMTPAQIAYTEYEAVHRQAGFPPMERIVMMDLKEVLGIDQDDKIDESGWRFLKGWAESVIAGTDDISAAWTDRVTKALSNGETK